MFWAYSLTVESDKSLYEVFVRTKGHAGVTVDFGPELLGDGPAKHAIIFEPGGIRIEFIWAGKKNP